MDTKPNKKFKGAKDSRKKSAPSEDISLATGNEKNDKDIFLEIDATANTNLLVKDQQSVPQNQQVEPTTSESKPSETQISMQEEGANTTAASIISSTNEIDEFNSFPPTLTRLNTANGSEVFLIGTAHFSLDSVNDVQKVIRAVRPSAVVLELCKERAFMLTLDEQSLLEQNRTLSFDKIRSAIAEKGIAQGLIYIMFIKMSANLTEKLGMAPGSEFRAGSAEAQKIPGCSIVLGDRSLKVTVARAVASISSWQKIKLIYQVLINDMTVTQEDVEKCKDKDILEQLLQELGGEFPGFKRVLLDERNVYLAHSIYQWAQNYETSIGPQRIVAIVGIGHVAGILENWGKTTNDDIVRLNEVPKTSNTRRIISRTIKYCSIALLAYIGYRAIVPSSIQSAIHDKIVNR